MSYAPIYGLKETRITLYEDDGTTPKYRITLQKETKEGLELAFKPEGVNHQLGSGSNWDIVKIHRGHRPELAIKWSHGLESWVQTWADAAWGASTLVPTAQALSVIHSRANRCACSVSPHLDMNFDFLAQPDSGKKFVLRDIKGVAHTGLELVLIGKSLIPDLPDWPTLNLYFVPGFVDEGFTGF